MIPYPKTTLNLIAENAETGLSEERVLLIGVKSSGGNAVAKSIYEIGNANEENSLFGSDSHLGYMCKTFRETNKVTKLYALPLDENSSAAAAKGEISFSGAASNNSRIKVSVCSKQKNTVTIDVLAGETENEIAKKVHDALAVYTDALFNTTLSTNSVLLESKVKGTTGNFFDIEIQGHISGAPATITPFSGGASNPTLVDAFDNLGEKRFQTIVFPADWDLTGIKEILNDRFNATNAVLNGVVVQTKSDTLANLKLYANQNSQSVVILGEKSIVAHNHFGNSVNEVLDGISTKFAALRSLRLTDGASLTQYITSKAALDQFGGIAMSSFPYFNTAVPNTAVPNQGEEFLQVENDELTKSGVSLFGANSSYSGTIFGEAVTTYLNSTSGIADSTYKFLNTVDTSTSIREYFFNRIKSTFAQSRLTNGALVKGRDLVNEPALRSFCIQLYSELADEALVQKGTEAEKDYNEHLTITVDVKNNSATINQAPLLVSQLREVIGTIQVNFGG